MGALDTAGRRRLALLGIVLAVAGAIWGVAEVTGGSDSFGSYDVAFAKLLPTAVAAALFSLVIGAGARLIDRQKDLAPIGYLTVLLGLVAFAAAARLAFRDKFFEEDDLAQSFWIAAIAAGQVSLLLSWPRRGDRGPAMATAVLAALATIALAVACVVEISDKGPNVDRELFGILTVAYLLGLVLVPLTTLASPASPRRAVRSGTDGLALDHASLLAADPAALARFYSILLGEEATQHSDGSGAFGIGRQLTVWESDESAASSAGSHVGPAALSFVWPGSPESATEMLHTIGATEVVAPVETRGARGDAASVSCRDPEGNSVDLICYRR